MYELHADDFGPFERCTLRHSAYPQEIQFIPDRGGCLISLRLEDQELLDGYTSPEEVEFNRWGKSGLLYPFPNRLEDGTYQWQGKTYQFPCNDTTHQNALHGFGMQRPLVITETQLSEERAVVRMSGEYDGSLHYYPWPFRVELSYHLYGPDSFWFEIAVQNTGTTEIPMGLGWHPYFQLAERAADCALRLPSVELIGIDARMIPTGKRYAHTEFMTLKPIGATVLDNCFAVADTQAEVSAHLSGPRGTIRYWQETGPQKFNYLQVFTPPYGTSVALEPMTCNVDAFNNGDGLVSLQAGAELRAKAGVQFMID